MGCTHRIQYFVTIREITKSEIRKDEDGKPGFAAHLRIQLFVADLNTG
jgi:hypothetical protein